MTSEKRDVTALSLRDEFVSFYEQVAKAEKFDTNAGDSAVSIVLWSRAELYEELKANA